MLLPVLTFTDNTPTELVWSATGGASVGGGGVYEFWPYEHTSTGGVSVGASTTWLHEAAWVGTGGARFGADSLVEFPTATTIEQDMVAKLGIGGAASWHFDGTAILPIKVGAASTVTFLTPTIYDIGTLDALPKGGVRWSGEANIGEVTSHIPTGGFVYAGAATVSEQIPFTASGGFVYAGSAEASSALSFEPTGGFVYSGESPNVTRFTIDTPTGGFVFSGTSSVDTYSAWHAPSGGYKFGGSAVMFMLAADYPSTTENPRGDPFYGWSINAENGAITRYYRLPANSICQLDGKTFVANDGGIYEYGADTDAGQPIRASVQFPKDDFDSNFTKRMEVVRFGLKASGRLRLKVDVNGDTPRYYPLDMNRSDVHGTRVYVGKGLAGRYWGFRLDNVAGADFSLDAVEFHPFVSKTRHGR